MAVYALTAAGEVELAPEYESAADVRATVRLEAEAAGSLTGSAARQPPPRVLLGTAAGGLIEWEHVTDLVER